MRSRIPGWWPRSAWPCLFLVVTSLLATPVQAQQPFFSNLLVNPDAETGDLSGWTITASGGAGWTVSGAPGDFVFRTSYLWDSREQVVDLYTKGFTAETMATAPLITLREEFRHVYCPDTYGIRVELLDADWNVVTFWDSGVRTTTGPCVPGLGEANVVSHTFRDYGPSVRYVRWSDGGKDSEFWGGHYGVAMDNASLRVFDDNHAAWFTNLLENGGAEAGDLSGWQVDGNGGAGWLAVDDPVQDYFITSYVWNTRHQLVDLWAHGFDPETLAKQPLIRVSERFTQAYCPDTFFLKAQVLDENMAVLASYDSGVRTLTGPCTWGPHDWVTLSHVFADYGPRARYVRFEDGGKDLEYWGGHYGAILDDAAVVVFGDNRLVNPGMQTGDLTGWQLAVAGSASVTAAARDGIAGNLALQATGTEARRTQVVDLLAQEVAEEALDSARTIHATGLYKPSDCVTPFSLKVTLLDDAQAVLATWDSGPQWAACVSGVPDWEVLSHAFSAGFEGVRYVRWEDGGGTGTLMDGAFLGLQDTSEGAPHQSPSRRSTSASFCGGEEQEPCYSSVWDANCDPDISNSCLVERLVCNDGLEVVYQGRQMPRCVPIAINCCTPVSFSDRHQGEALITQGYSARVNLSRVQPVVPAADAAWCPPGYPSIYRSVGYNDPEVMTETGMMSTGSWMDQHPDIQLMINANFFNLSEGYLPYVDLCTKAFGLSISDGVVASPSGSLFGKALATLVFYSTSEARQRNRPAEIRTDLTGGDASRFRQAVSGFQIVKDKKYIRPPSDITPECGRPRTIVGLNDTGKMLFIAVVNPGRDFMDDSPGGCVRDGTNGASTFAMASYLYSLGARDILLLDGGGSSQLVYSPDDAPQQHVSTLPSDGRSEAPGLKFFRPVPTFLGFK
ncbi:phosphodiester glycosidase family protein [Myxococcus sp. AM011]|uniref:phosphodiester glycosidase family protein n=1 Tax=Myxococcus sp. AM011 TaxID=2745200 RepID=UPI0015957B24|nr:phosphodiester glycosidase family protein [Myxococcus sp. AM011]NVJ22028.1 phosphodiester glycosidase family protein [Myxococcus sp. AM011]